MYLQSVAAGAGPEPAVLAGLHRVEEVLADDLVALDWVFSELCFLAMTDSSLS